MFRGCRNSIQSVFVVIAIIKTCDMTTDEHLKDTL